MKPLSLHPIAARRRHHTFRVTQRRSPIVQACAEELALIVDHRRSLVGD